MKYLIYDPHDNHYLHNDSVLEHFITCSALYVKEPNRAKEITLKKCRVAIRLRKYNQQSKTIWKIKNI